MSADTSPLSDYWRRPRPVDTRPASERVALADQIAEELVRVGAGEFPAYVLLSRYSQRELLGAMCHWGLTSDLTRQLQALQHPPRRAADDDRWALPDPRGFADE